MSLKKVRALKCLQLHRLYGRCTSIVLLIIVTECLFSLLWCIEGL